MECTQNILYSIGSNNVDSVQNVDSLQCPKGDHKHDCHCQVLPSAPLARPEWLQGVVPEAEVHSTVLKLFDEFHDSGQNLATVMKSVTGKHNSIPVLDVLDK